MAQDSTKKEDKSSTKLRKLQNYLDDIVINNIHVYNAVMLVETPEFTWKGASGYAHPDERLPMADNDQFYTASTAKMLAATLAMKLVERGLFSLDEKIHPYISDSIMDRLHEYENRSYGNAITVRQLLNHTSGLGDNWSDRAFLKLILSNTDKLWEPEETIEYVKKNCPPHFPPGEGFYYSDINYNLIGLVIEKVTGKPLHNIYRELLFDPLQMNHTYMQFREPPRSSITGRLPSCSYVGDINYTSFRSLSADWAGGGLQTTCEDLNQFLRAFFRNDIFEEISTRDEMAAWRKISQDGYYGLGVIRWVLDEAGDPDLAGCGELLGHQGASGSFMYYWDVKDTTICGTINQADEKMIGEVVTDTLKILLA
ncbi:MAG: beta-lactamase family protein [Theionarchaea archaeon]|nr:beta-lactamase family protein [Theionarchaea archaeon]